MLLKELCRKVNLTEGAIAFLREHNLLDTVQEADPCHNCRAVMQEKESVKSIKPIVFFARCGKMHGSTKRLRGLAK